MSEIGKASKMIPVIAVKAPTILPYMVLRKNANDCN